MQSLSVGRSICRSATKLVLCSTKIYSGAVVSGAPETVLNSVLQLQFQISDSADHARLQRATLSNLSSHKNEICC
jgi:hypothetical protein